MRYILFFLVLSVVSCQVFAKTHPLLKRDWLLLESDNFSLMTDVEFDDAEVLIRDLEQFRKVVLTITGIGEIKEPIDTRVIIFSKASHFNKVAFRADIAGYMRAALRGNRMVTSGKILGMDQRVVMFHEYVHHLIRIASERNYPTWYDEGLADMLATIHVRGENVVVGATLEERVQTLNDNSHTLPMARVVNEDNLSGLRRFQINYFYGAAWAMVNFLHTAHLAGFPERMSQLQAYLELVNQQVERPKAFEQAFGTTPRSLAGEMNEYLQLKRRPVLMLPAEKFAYTKSISHRGMSRTETALELGFQMMTSKPKKARQLIDSAIELDPDNHFLKSAKGITYQMEGNHSAGVRFVREAFESDRTSATLAIDYADLLVFWSRRECQEKPTALCQKRYEEALATYRVAIQNSPDNPELNAALGWLLFETFAAYEEALNYLRYALGFHPWNPVLRLRVGLVYKNLNQNARAVEHLKKALYWSERAAVRKQAEDALVSLGAIDPINDADGGSSKN